MQKINKKPLNFVFGTVKYYKATFLIQNMFPTIEQYIEEKYQVRKSDGTIPAALQREIIEKSEDVLRLSTKGIHIAFSNLPQFKEELLNEINNNI